MSVNPFAVKLRELKAEYDQARSLYLNGLGFTVLRFWNDEILRQTDEVLAEILRVLQELERLSER